jgi:hypothetical protein
VSITKLELVDQSGRAISANATSAERKAAFPPLGVVNVSKLRWVADGNSRELDIVKGGKKLSWQVLPDLSGIAITNKDEGTQSKVIVYNVDASIRFELENPWPQHKAYAKSDRYGFSYPAVENNELGAVVWVWAASPAGAGVAVEHFYSIDLVKGAFLKSHPIK